MRYGYLALLLTSAAHAQPAARPDLDDLIITYNALPDTPAPLTPGALPDWARSLPLSRPETAALVALAGAYTTVVPSAPAARSHAPGPLEYVASFVLALKTQEELNRANPGTAPNVWQSAPGKPRPQRVIPRPASERFIRLIGALESCPAAFASLAIKLHAAQADSVLDTAARRARSDNLAFAIPPSPTCAK